MQYDITTHAYGTHYVLQTTLYYKLSMSRFYCRSSKRSARVRADDFYLTRLKTVAENANVWSNNNEAKKSFRPGFCHLYAADGWMYT